MKLLLITSVLQFEKDVSKIFEKAEILVYSTSDIQGQKFFPSKTIQNNWFSAQRDSHDSKLYFAFTTEDKIEAIFKGVEAFNAEKSKSNPIKAIVLDIEKFIN